MKNNWQTKKINNVLLILIFLLIASGFWGYKIVLILTNGILLSFYPQLLVTLIGVALGIPTGLFINSLTEKKKDKKNITSTLTFIKTELVLNQENIENLQHSAETISSMPNITREDLKTFSKFNTVLIQQSYIAAQSSITFTSIDNDKLMSGIINAYLNIQRIVSGAKALGEIEPNEAKVLLISYIKLCERAKESICFCLAEIDDELKKFGGVITILK